MICVRSLSGEVLWGPKDFHLLDPLMIFDDLKQQLGEGSQRQAMDLLQEDVLLPSDAKLSHLEAQARAADVVELTLVVHTCERPEIPPGLYISELNNHRLSRWEAGAGAVVLGGFGRGAARGQLAGPRGICGHQGVVYVAEQGKVSSWYLQSKGLGICGRSFTGNKGIPLQEPSSVCVDGGWLYVADSKAHMVSRWCLEDPTVGEVVAGGRGPGDTLEQLNRPMGVAVDSIGRVYVSEFGNDRVTRWESRCATVVAGGQGEGDGLEQLSGPSAVLLQEGRSVAITVCELGNHRISRWWPGQSRCEVLVGDVGTCPELQGPQALALDQQGRILVAEGSANRVTRWPPGTNYGEVIAGGHGRGDDLDQLNGPCGILLVP